MVKLSKFIAIIAISIAIFGSFFYLNFAKPDKGEAAKESKLQVEQFLIKVLVKEGKNLTTQLRVMNVGKKGMNVGVRPINLKFLTAAKPDFYVDYGQSADVDLVFTTATDHIKQETGVYVGKIEIIGDDERKEIPLIAAIESEDVLFSVNIDMPLESRRLIKGTSGLAYATVYNLKKIGPANLLMKYEISDTNGNKIISESESAVVEDKTTFTKTIRIPENVLAGYYVFTASAKYGSSAGVASNLIEVVEPAEKNKLSYFERCAGNPYCFSTSVLVLFLILFAVQYIYFTYEIHKFIKKASKSVFKQFFHKIGFYKTPEEKRQIALQKEEEKRKQELRILRLYQQRKKKIKELFHKIGLYKTAEEKKDIDLQREKEEGIRQEEKLRRQKQIEQKKKELEKQKELETKRKEEDSQKRKLESAKLLQKRKKQIRDFFHNIGLYKTPEEKKAIALQKEKEKQEKLRKEQEIKKQKAEEERIRREQELNKQKEFEKQKSRILQLYQKRKKQVKEFFHSISLHKTPEQKRQIALKKEEEQKRRQFEEQKKKQEELRRQEELQRQKKLEAKRKEEEKKARKIKIEKLWNERKKQIKNFFHKIGPRRTNEGKNLIEAVLEFAFKRKPAIDHKLIKETKKWRDEGYDYQTIRRILISKNYDIIDIENAIDYMKEKEKENVGD